MNRNQAAFLASLVALTLLAACGGSSDHQPAATLTAGPTSSPAGVSAEDLAHAVVQIHALDPRGDTVWTGSGTFISPDGLILTNAHVVDDRNAEYDQLAVAIAASSDQPAHLAYLADIAAVDYVLDLALIRITSDLDGNEVDQRFPYVAIGDSDQVEIGDEVRILGFPGIGGDTITFTKGAVSGFTADRSVGGRAWIKTDATIAGGNSGGLAVNAAGQLIGVPTIVGSGADTQNFVDCRYVADSNGDGRIDSNDDCVPVGGFINGIRPVNLAQPLIDAVQAGQPYVSRFGSVNPQTTPGKIVDTALVSFENLLFSDGVTDDDTATTVSNALPSGVQRICGFWDYQGMVDGVRWDAQWFVNGELDEGGSIIDDTWIGGDSGNWWVCIINEDAGLDDGLYELVLSVEGQFQNASAIWVGGQHPDIQLVIDNQSDFQICAAFLSPVGAQNWGENDLAGRLIAPGDAMTIIIPAGPYDIMTMDCDEEIITEDRDLDISEDSTYTITNA